MKSQGGFTFVELLVVIAIIGIVAAIGFANLPRDRFAVNQTAEGLMRDFQLARFEAIRRNEFVGLRVDPSAQQYVLFEDRFVGTTRNSQPDEGEIFKTVRISEFGPVKVTDETSTTMIFDPRGIPSGIAVGVQLNNQSESYPKRICVSTQGRPRVVAATSCS